MFRSAPATGPLLWGGDGRGGSAGAATCPFQSREELKRINLGANLFGDADKGADNDKTSNPRARAGNKQTGVCSQQSHTVDKHVYGLPIPVLADSALAWRVYARA